MIVPDINLLVYAYNTDAPDHDRARTWWEASLSDPRPVGLAWMVMLGYLRLMTSRNVLIDPFTPSDAIGHVRSWLARPQVLVLSPRTSYERSVCRPCGVLMSAQSCGRLWPGPP